MNQQIIIKHGNELIKHHIMVLYLCNFNKQNKQFPTRKQQLNKNNEDIHM